jgi:hypothetical protein
MSWAAQNDNRPKFGRWKIYWSAPSQFGESVLGWTDSPWAVQDIARHGGNKHVKAELLYPSDQFQISILGYYQMFSWIMEYEADAWSLLN